MIWALLVVAIIAIIFMFRGSAPVSSAQAPPLRTLPYVPAGSQASSQIAVQSGNLIPPTGNVVPSTTVPTRAQVEQLIRSWGWTQVGATSPLEWLHPATNARGGFLQDGRFRNVTAMKDFWPNRYFAGEPESNYLTKV